MSCGLVFLCQWLMVYVGYCLDTKTSICNILKTAINKEQTHKRLRGAMKNHDDK